MWHTTDKPTHVLDKFNSEVTDFERFTTPYAMSFERANSDTDGTKLFDTPSWEQSDDAELFLQFDPLDNDTGFLSDIDGYTYFTFGDAAHTPARIRFVIDRS